MTQKRIAIAGFQHETNTFAPFKSGFAEFEMADSWPGLLRGDDVISGTKGINLPIAGAAQAAEEGGIKTLPILWCAAEPSGYVTDTAFDRIAGMILDGLAKAGPLDGLYLDLHGAMVTESHQDGEAELLRRIRTATGPDLPIGISLDMHANLSAELVKLTHVITMFRTYPHLDMAETGGRAITKLCDVITGQRPYSAFRQVPFLIPTHAQYTGAAPCNHIYASLGQDAEFAMGFTAGDVPDCGPSVLAYGGTQAEAETLADRVLKDVITAEHDFPTHLYTPHDVAKTAMTIPDTVTIADVQDNPGAGGSGDTVGILKALVEAEANDAFVGVIADADIAEAAHRLGIGATFQAALGGTAGIPGDTPFEASFTVNGLSDGQIAYTGEMYGGGIAQIGPSALLSINGAQNIQVVVSSLRTQCLDLAFFTHFGLDPTQAKILCIKSTVHFMADFAPISDAVLFAAAPGLFPCDLSQIAYKNVTRRLPRNG